MAATVVRDRPGRRCRSRRAAAIAGWLLCLLAAPSMAQELSPRAYWPAPTGTQLVLAGYAYSWGDVVTDPSLPISGVDSRINTGIAGYQQTVDLFGRTTNFKVELPYTIGTTQGFVFGQSAQADFNGLGDLALTLSVNLYGAPAMDRQAFGKLVRDPHPIIGASLRVVAPTGEYHGDKLINIGTNRWAARLQFGYIQPLQPRWLLETSAGVWFFQDNDDFLGVTRSQDPIAALEVHLIRVMNAGAWLALDGNYYAGGRTDVDGQRRADFQRNVRAGLTVAWPFRKRHLLKLSLSRGVVTESGGDYTMATLAYAVAIN
jgi:hypothetical protein